MSHPEGCCNSFLCLPPKFWASKQEILNIEKAIVSDFQISTLNTGHLRLNCSRSELSCFSIHPWCANYCAIAERLSTGRCLLWAESVALAGNWTALRSTNPPLMLGAPLQNCPQEGAEWDALPARTISLLLEVGPSNLFFFSINCL